MISCSTSSNNCLLSAFEIHVTFCRNHLSRCFGTRANQSVGIASHRPWCSCDSANRLWKHSRPQRPRTFSSAPRITTSGQVQWDSGSILNGFANRIEWDQYQSDLSDLTLNMRRVTGSPWIAHFRCWSGPEVAILGADQKRRGLWGREWPLKESNLSRSFTKVPKSGTLSQNQLLPHLVFSLLRKQCCSFYL